MMDAYKKEGIDRALTQNHFYSFFLSVHEELGEAWPYILLYFSPIGRIPKIF